LQNAIAQDYIYTIQSSDTDSSIDCVQLGFTHYSSHPYKHAVLVLNARSHVFHGMASLKSSYNIQLNIL